MSPRVDLLHRRTCRVLTCAAWSTLACLRALDCLAVLLTLPCLATAGLPFPHPTSSYLTVACPRPYRPCGCSAARKTSCMPTVSHRRQQRCHCSQPPHAASALTSPFPQHGTWTQARVHAPRTTSSMGTTVRMRRYDFATSDTEFDELRRVAAHHPWGTRRPVAHFRGSVYWYERHGRTRAYAQSLVAPHDVDVDWYEAIDTSSLEVDGAPIFGNISAHARFK